MNAAPKFDDALVSLSTYTHVDEVPNAFFRRVLEIMRTSHLSGGEACERMAGALQTSRETIQAKLAACKRTPQAQGILSTRRELSRISRP